MRAIQIVFATVLSFVIISLNAQQRDSTHYKDQFIDVNGITLHYLDFGGSGLPIIFLQSFHGDAREWVDYDYKGFAPKFSKDNRVFAITRRGWGKSTDPGWGYDVATNGEDVVAFMDALKIQKAILIGRIPGSMDMTWIAEHHTSRVAGLVYWDIPYVYIETSDSLLRKYVEMFALLACDLGSDAIRKSMPRASWRPHFLKQQKPTIPIPALWFSPYSFMPKMSRELMSFDMLIAQAKEKDFKECDTTATAYFISLSKDEGLQKKIKEALLKTNNTPSLIADFEKAFDPQLKIVKLNPPPQDINTVEAFFKYWEEVSSVFYFNHISNFIKGLK